MLDNLFDPIFEAVSSLPSVHFPLHKFQQQLPAPTTSETFEVLNHWQSTHTCPRSNCLRLGIVWDPSHWAEAKSSLIPAVLELSNIYSVHWINPNHVMESLWSRYLDILMTVGCVGDMADQLVRREGFATTAAGAPRVKLFLPFPFEQGVRSLNKEVGEHYDVVFFHNIYDHAFLESLELMSLQHAYGLIEGQNRSEDVQRNGVLLVADASKLTEDSIQRALSTETAVKVCLLASDQIDLSVLATIAHLSRSHNASLDVLGRECERVRIIDGDSPLSMLLLDHFNLACGDMAALIFQSESVILADWEEYDWISSYVLAHDPAHVQLWNASAYERVASFKAPSIQE